MRFCFIKKDQTSNLEAKYLNKMPNVSELALKRPWLCCGRATGPKNKLRIVILLRAKTYQIPPRDTS